MLIFSANSGVFLALDNFFAGRLYTEATTVICCLGLRGKIRIKAWIEETVLLRLAKEGCPSEYEPVPYIFIKIYKGRNPIIHKGCSQFYCSCAVKVRIIQQINAISCSYSESKGLTRV